MKEHLEEILDILKDAVENLYHNDRYLLENRIHEQDMSHRIAYYFEKELQECPWFDSKKYSVDVEYNRNLDEPKHAYTKCQKCNQKNCFITQNKNNVNLSTYSRPDIILHVRGENNETTKEYNNIIVIEIKKEQGNDIKDTAKMTAFTCSKGDYKYHIGVYLDLELDRYIITRFADGKITGDAYISFIKE